MNLKKNNIYPRQIHYDYTFDFLEYCVKFFLTDSKWGDHILRLLQKPENKRWRGFCRSCGKKHQKFARHVDFYGDRDITRPNLKTESIL